MAEAVKKMQLDALEKLKNALAQQCSDAESTLKDALETALESMRSAVSANTFAMNTQLATVKSDVKVWTPKLFRAIKIGVFWPILTTALLCLLMISGSIAWWKIEDREHIHLKPFITDRGEQLMVVDEPKWGYCPDQTITDKGTGKKTVYQQRCGKVE
jgi:hypothetical protein